RGQRDPGSTGNPSSAPESESALPFIRICFKLPRISADSASNRRVPCPVKLGVNREAGLPCYRIASLLTGNRKIRNRPQLAENKASSKILTEIESRHFGSLPAPDKPALRASASADFGTASYLLLNRDSRRKRVPRPTLRGEFLATPKISIDAHSSLLQRLTETRCRTDALFKLLPPDSFYLRPIPERHRLIFYLGHLEAFDWNLLREPLGLEATEPAFDKLFAFGIDPVDGGLPSDVPGDWPSISRVENYSRGIR